MKSRRAQTIESHLPPLLGLFLLLALTCGSSYLRLGAGNLAVTLIISGLKTLLVACFFMELRKAVILLRLAAFVGLVWLLIYLLLVFSDYGTRFPGRLLDHAETRKDSVVRLTRS